MESSVSNRGIARSGLARPTIPQDIVTDRSAGCVRVSDRPNSPGTSTP